MSESDIKTNGKLGQNLNKASLYRNPLTTKKYHKHFKKL